MLSAVNRLRLTAEFKSVVHSRLRIGRPTLVIHAVSNGESPSEVGFAVSKGVGGAVVRNRVKRQLRHLVRDELTQYDPHLRVVVRALPAAAEQDGRLTQDLRSAWAQAIKRLAVEIDGVSR